MTLPKKKTTFGKYVYTYCMRFVHDIQHICSFDYLDPSLDILIKYNWDFLSPIANKKDESN